MNKNVFHICLFLAILIDPGCSLGEYSQNQINDLEARITTVQTQIQNINSSLGNLKQVDSSLNSYINALQENLKKEERYCVVEKSIKALMAADSVLIQKIVDLESYCNLRKDSQCDWTITTFTSLEQQGAVLADIATIKTKLGDLNEQVNNLSSSLLYKISDEEDRVVQAILVAEVSVKGWISELLEGYYTISQADAKLELLMEKLQEYDAELAGNIESLRIELDSASLILTVAYQTAISEAININFGIINDKIAADIEAANNALQRQLDDINTRMDNLEQRITALEGTVSELIGMLQSVVVVPDYSDGFVKMTGRQLDTIRFEVYPLNAAMKLAEKGASVFSLAYIETETSSHLNDIPISGVLYGDGFLSIVADGSSLPIAVKDGVQSFNARLLITDGYVMRSSEYFGVRISPCPSREIIAYADILSAGETLQILDFPQYLKSCGIVSFKAKVSSFKEISVGFGYETNAIHAKIDGTYLYIVKSGTTIYGKWNHGLEVSDFITITFENDYFHPKVVVSTKNGAFVKELNEFPSLESYGHPSVLLGDLTEVTEAELRATSDMFMEPVWVVGDSYVSLYSERWTYQMVKTLGHYDFLILGLAGGDSSEMYADLLKALKYGTPNYLLWCLGMNESFFDWKTHLELIQALCRVNGINLVLQTIPIPNLSTSSEQEDINGEVRKSGYRYVDACDALCPNNQYPWYTGYCSDGVHPTELGAKVLAARVLSDFPEIASHR